MKTGVEQLRDWMKRRGVNQAETADILGFDFTFVSHILNGRRQPGLANAIKIERHTGIPVEAWLSSERDKLADDRPTDVVSDQ